MSSAFVDVCTSRLTYIVAQMPHIQPYTSVPVAGQSRESLGREPSSSFPVCVTRLVPTSEIVEVVCYTHTLRAQTGVGGAQVFSTPSQIQRRDLSNSDLYTYSSAVAAAAARWLQPPAIRIRISSPSLLHLTTSRRLNPLRRRCTQRPRRYQRKMPHLW